MELFEEVGQTLSRAGQGLAQKARDTAQVTKLKLAVSEDERAIEGIYLSIGKAYCRMCEACSPEQLPHPSRSRLCWQAFGSGSSSCSTSSRPSASFSRS